MVKKRQRTVAKQRSSSAPKEQRERLWAAAAGEVLSPITLGLAHDLNNQLTGILSISDLCLREESVPEKLREQLEVVRSSSQRAADLVRTLFLEHQAQTGQTELYDLNMLVGTYFELVRRAISKSVEITLNVNPEPLPVRIDGVAFRTALLHLVLALASASKETIEIRTFSERAPGKGAHSKEWAGCSVKAEGKPPASEFRKNSKAEFSLDLLKQFARDSEGAVSVDPNKSAGLAVTIRLPLVDLT